MLSYYEMKLQTAKRTKENRIIRCKKEAEDSKLRWKEYYARRKSRKQKWIKVTMPEYLRRLEKHIEKEIVHGIEVGFFNLDNDMEIRYTDRYLEKRYIVEGKRTITKETNMFTSTGTELKEIGEMRKLKSLQTLAWYFKIKDMEMLDKILNSIGERIGLKITRVNGGLFKTDIHLEIR